MIKISGNDQVQYSTTSKHVKNYTSEWYKKKLQHFFPNAVRSLLYIRFVAVAFQLWRSSPLEKGPHWPIMALPWIHHCADLAQKSIQMCGSHEYSQMLVDNCYAFSLLLQHSNWWRSSLEKGPLIDILWPCSGSAPRRILPKSEYKWAGSWVLYP